MKAYKGFNNDLTCRGFQYEEGKEYTTESASLCHSGFHACLNPLDCFGYYAPGSSRYHEVEIDDNGERHDDDTKICGKKIKIGAELSVAQICKLHFEYVKSNCVDSKSNVAGDKESASAGNYGSASAGESGSASAGESGSAVSRGSVSVGPNGTGLVRGGTGIKIKGGLGAVLMIALENDNNYDIKHTKTFVVDGEKIKADTWYTLSDAGRLKQVK